MSDDAIFAIVLAAGAGSRFGGVKQLARYRELPLVTRALRLAEEVCGPRTVLVAGHEWRAVVDACLPMQGIFVYNDRYRDGLGGSIACGVRAVADVATAIMLLLGDQALVSRQHLEHLIATWKNSREDVVATGFTDIAGPPAIFPQRDFAALLALAGDTGARAVLTQAGSRVRVVPFEDAAVDVDYPEDLENLP